jgi:hypothetical protein
VTGRVAALTRHIMDRELPHVPVRQWVLSLPYPLRYRLAYDQPLCTAVHRALAHTLRLHLRRLARERGHRDAQTGSVTFVQRYGGGLNLNVHFTCSASTAGSTGKRADSLRSSAPRARPSAT